MEYDEVIYHKCREKAEDFLWEKQIIEKVIGTEEEAVS